MAQLPAVIPSRSPSILGADGMPMQRMADVLQTEIAGPTVRGVRSIMTGHPADGLSPQRLAALLRQSEDGRDPEAYLELAEAMEERDLHYVSVLGTRKRQVAQLPITVEAASDDAADQEAADLVREVLERDTIEDELFDILDNVGKGFSITEILWERGPQRWMPRRLKRQDPRFFAFAEDGETPLLRGEGGQLLPLPPYKFIVHTSGSKSGLPIRGGLARPVAWAYLFKNYAIKDWVAFAEIFGLPFRFGRYENGATEADIAKLMRAVADIGTDAAAVFPKSMEVEFLDGKTNAGPELYSKLAEYLDKQVSKAVLGQTATTDSEGGGLGGSGKQHGEVRGDIERADAKAAAATLNRDLVRPLVDLNLGRRQRYPKVVIAREEAEDLKAKVDAVAVLVPLGLRISESEMRDKLGFADPGPDERILGAPAATLPAGAQAGQEGPGAPVRPVPRQIPRTPALTASYGLSPADLAAAPADDLASAAGDDAIDAFAARTGDDWQPMPDPLLAPVEQLLASAATLEDVRDGLAGLLSADTGGQITELLARGLFGTRLAALTGQRIGDS